MPAYTIEVITSQIGKLNEKLAGPFPYEDCQLLLTQVRETGDERSRSRYEDLISDLDAYFYLVASHSGGAENLTNWTVSELMVSQGLLKNSFFQAHAKYRSMEWMINEINTHKLYAILMVSNELRAMLLKLISDLVEQSKRVNVTRQNEFLYA